MHTVYQEHNNVALVTQAFPSIIELSRGPTFGYIEGKGGGPG